MKLTTAGKLELANLLFEMKIINSPAEYFELLNAPDVEEYLRQKELLEKVKKTKLFKAMK
jgi:hypothetical protein